MPLRMRLSLLFALATAVAVALAGPAFVAQLRVSVEASLDPGLRAQLADVADDLGAEDPDTVGPGMVVEVAAPDGRILSSTSPTALLTDAQRREALRGEMSFTARVGGERTRVLAGPATREGAPVVVAVGTRTVVSDVAVERAELALLLGAPAAVLLAGIGAWVLAGAALRPVERMRREAADISDRELDRRLGVPATRDEIAALGTTINALLGRLQDALNRERGFVADAGHELRTPLAILRAELELAARPGRSREALVEAINEAGAETDRLIRLAEDLLLLARADNHQPFLRPQRLSVPDLLHAAARGAGTRAAEREVALTVHAPAPLEVEADPDRLRQAVDNLLDNATRHSPRGGVVELTAALPRPDTLVIEVGDRGPGFPADFLPHAFDRFHRAGDARSRDDGGTGLGLAIVRAIAQAHGGGAVARNRPGGGAVVRIELPTVGPPPPGSGQAGATAGRAPDREQVRPDDGHADGQEEPMGVPGAAPGARRWRQLLSRRATAVPSVAATLLGALTVLAGCAAPAPAPTRAAVPSPVQQAVPAPASPDGLPGMPPVTDPHNVYAAAGAGMLSPVVGAAKPLVYVPHTRSRDVWVIDPTTFAVVARYPVGSGELQHVVPSWDLRTLYASDDKGNELTPFDPTTGTPGAPIPVTDPYNLYFTPDGRSAISVAERRRELVFYDPHTWAVQDTLPTPDCAGIDHADFTPDGRTAVFTCEFAGRVAVVDVAAHRILRMIDMPRRNTVMGPQDIKLAPDGSVFYIADSDQNGVWVLDGAATRVVREIPTGRGAHGLYLSRDATRLYVTNRHEGSVSVLDAYTGAPVTTWTLPGGGSPDMGNVTADGTQLWLSGRYDRSVYVLSTTDGHLIRRIAVGDGPHGLCVWPQPGRYSLGHTGITR